MVKVKIGEFRDHVSDYVRRAENGETVVIVNRDRDVAVLQACRPTGRRNTSLLGCMKGTAKVVGDIVGPLIPETDWFQS